MHPFQFCMPFQLASQIPRSGGPPIMRPLCAGCVACSSRFLCSCFTEVFSFFGVLLLFFVLLCFCCFFLFFVVFLFSWCSLTGLRGSEPLHVTLKRTSSRCDTHIPIPTVFSSQPPQIQPRNHTWVSCVGSKSFFFISAPELCWFFFCTPHREYNVKPQSILFQPMPIKRTRPTHTFAT